MRVEFKTLYPSKPLYTNTLTIYFIYKERVKIVIPKLNVTRYKYR